VEFNQLLLGFEAFLFYLFIYLFIRRKATGHSAIWYEGTWRSSIALLIFKFDTTWWLVVSAISGSFTTLKRAPVTIVEKAGWGQVPVRQFWRIEKYPLLGFVPRTS